MLLTVCSRQLTCHLFAEDFIHHLYYVYLNPQFWRRRFLMFRTISNKNYRWRSYFCQIKMKFLKIFQTKIISVMIPQLLLGRLSNCEILTKKMVGRRHDGRQLVMTIAHVPFLVRWAVKGTCSNVFNFQLFRYYSNYRNYCEFLKYQIYFSYIFIIFCS